MRRAAEARLEGHPDKVCDQIADAIVDEFLRRDPESLVDLRVLGSHGMLVVSGEISSRADFDVAALARAVYADIGYADEVEVFVNVDHPSSEMARVRGATDAVIVQGYATKETRELLPKPLVYARLLAKRLEDMRKSDPAFSWLKPDGKVQVVMEKEHVVAMTILAAHAPDIDAKDVQTALLEHLAGFLLNKEPSQIFINPAGPFTISGFLADAGVSGYAAASDTYGGLIPHGDKPFCGKDPRKAERAGLYVSRAAARFLVEQEMAVSAAVTVAYTLNRAEPLFVEARGIGEKSRGAKMDLTSLVKRAFDFRPEAIVERFDLAKPMYRNLSVHGPFGREDAPWECPAKKE